LIESKNGDEGKKKKRDRKGGTVTGPKSGTDCADNAVVVKKGRKS